MTIVLAQHLSSIAVRAALDPQCQDREVRLEHAQIKG